LYTRHSSLDLYIQTNHADLIGLSLDGANCEGINLFGARLVKTSFSRCNLRDAEISYADVSGANFRQANLCGVYRSNVRSVRFHEARMDSDSDVPGRRIVGPETVRVA